MIILLIDFVDGVSI